MLFHSVHRPLHSSPVPFARCHRYLSRPYVYPLFFMLVLFLLVRWNAVPDPGTTGARFSSDDEIAFEDTKLQVEEGNDGDTNDIVDAEEDEAQTVKATEEGPKRVIQLPSGAGEWCAGAAKDGPVVAEQLGDTQRRRTKRRLNGIVLNGEDVTVGLVGEEKARWTFCGGHGTNGRHAFGNNNSPLTNGSINWKMGPNASKMG